MTAADQQPPSPGRPTTGRTGGRWVKVSRRKRRRRRRIRRIGLAVLGGLVVIVVGYLLVTALLARRELEAVRSEVGQLRAEVSAGDLAGARETATALAGHAERAHSLTTGPIWAPAAALPGGGPLDSIRHIAAGVDLAGGRALPELVAAADVIHPARLRSADGAIDLHQISSASPGLTRAAAALDDASAIVSSAPADTWLGTVDSARASLAGELSSLTHTVDGAAVAARIAPTMLGADGPKNYLVSFETESELRGTGGLPGAFAIVRADRGRLTFTRFESDTALSGVPSGLELGADFDQLYAGDKAPQEYDDSNISPNFPYAARIWVAMWQHRSGQRLDGAFAIDPTALSYLLAVTGPAALPDHTSVSAANVVALTQQQVYARFPDTDERKAYQLQVAKAIADHLIDASADTTGLLQAAGKAAAERRLLGWSSDPAVEAELMQTALGGAVVRTDAPYVALTLNNAAATKLDYYLDASLHWQRSGCGDTRQVTVTITVRNGAPAKLPDYVYGQTGQRNRPQIRGENRMLVSFYATDGAQATSVTLDGTAAGVGSGRELGHTVFTMLVDLPRLQTRTIVLHLREPAGRGSPVVVPQPMVRPLQISVTDADCG